MKLEELKEEKQKGSYAGVKFSKKTNDDLVNYIKANKIIGGVPKNKLHCTLLYSRKFLPDYKAKGKLSPPMIGKPKGFHIWKTQSGKHALVLTFSCPELVKRHKELMKDHDAQYDYDEYKTHVTLSYDVGEEFKIKDLKDIEDFVENIEIVKEYQEDLDLDWADTNVKK